MATDLEQSLDNIALSIRRYTAQMAEDAIEPLGTYSIDGESCSQNEWRESIQRTIDGLMESYRKIAAELGEDLQLEWLGLPPSQRTPYDARD